jgi:hypothetical protein
MADGTAILEVQTRKCVECLAQLGIVCGIRVFETIFHGAFHVNPIVADIGVMEMSVRAMFEKMHWPA